MSPTGWGESYGRRGPSPTVGVSYNTHIVSGTRYRAARARATRVDLTLLPRVSSLLGRSPKQSDLNSGGRLARCAALPSPARVAYLSLTSLLPQRTRAPPACSHSASSPPPCPRAARALCLPPRQRRPGIAPLASHRRPASALALLLVPAHQPAYLFLSARLGRPRPFRLEFRLGPPRGQANASRAELACGAVSEEKL